MQTKITKISDLYQTSIFIKFNGFVIIIEPLKIRTNKNTNKQFEILAFYVKDDSDKVNCIKCTAFGNEALRINEILKLNNFYCITNGYFRPTDKNYNKFSHSLDFFCTANTVIEECGATFQLVDENNSLADFCSIADLCLKQNKDFFSISGIIMKCSGI